MSRSLAGVTFRIEHLLSARLYLSPQVVGDRVFFISDISGRLSLYAMDRGGSVPEPLLPPDVALMTPELLDGEAFVALPDHGVVVVMIDHAGDENYQPCVIPIDGGDPEPVFGDRFAGQQVELIELDEKGTGSIWVDPRVRPEQEAYEIRVGSDELVPLGASKYGNDPIAHSDDRRLYVLLDEYTVGDTTLWLTERGSGERRLLHGVPIDDRADGHKVLLNGFGGAAGSSTAGSSCSRRRCSTTPAGWVGCPSTGPMSSSRWRSRERATWGRASSPG